MSEILLLDDNFKKFKDLKETDGITFSNVQYGNMYVGDVKTFVNLQNDGNGSYIKHCIDCEITSFQRLSEYSIWVKVKKLKEYKK